MIDLVTQYSVRCTAQWSYTILLAPIAAVNKKFLVTRETRIVHGAANPNVTHVPHAQAPGLFVWKKGIIVFCDKAPLAKYRLILRSEKG